MNHECTYNASSMSIILLDIGNVIVSVDFMPFCRAVSPDGASGVQDIYSKYCVSDLKNELDRGMVAPFEYLGMIAADPLTVSMPLHEIRDRWQNIFTLKDGCPPAVRQLKTSHTVWIMSDTDPLHFAYLLNNYPVLREMERYYLSYAHGNLKSSVEAFRHVLESSGCQAGEFILIDDRKENCASCEEAGMSSLLFRSWPETLAALDLHPDAATPP